LTGAEVRDNLRIVVEGRTTMSFEDGHDRSSRPHAVTPRESRPGVDPVLAPGIPAAALAALSLLAGCWESSPWTADAVAETDGCVLGCARRECGPNPACGGTCGSGCGADETCDADGHCFPTAEGEWVAIAPGTFRMGSPGVELGRNANETIHRVTLTRGFAIKATEVTQREFQARMGYNPSRYGCAECPVERISWYEGAAYANALSAAAGRPACYSCAGSGRDVLCDASGAFATPYDCPGYRLPTEAEWEYAARAGTETATYNGDLDFAHLECQQPNPVLDPIAWFCGNSGDVPHPVGTRAPNAWGLYDMAGNISEWCNDATTGVALPAAAVTDPWGSPGSFGRASHDGSWINVARYSRAADRGAVLPDSRNSNRGFRVVRTLP